MSDWISVAERMPENHKEKYLVAYDTGRVDVDRLSYSSSRPEFMFKHRGTATHWMPLPDLPEGAG